LFRSTLALALVAASTFAFADPLYVKNDNLTYSGTVSRYGTEADARARTNAISSTAIQTATNGANTTFPGARDGNIEVSQNAPSPYFTTNEVAFQTAWYFTNETGPNRVIDGWGNPNNRNEGFVQYIDRTNVPSVTGGWSNGYTTFNLNIAGGDGDFGNFARLWAAPSTLGSSTGGLFVDFNLNITAQFLTAATLSGTSNWYETNVMPSNLTGTASGVFLNQSSQTALNGYYAFDFALTNAGNSWAFNNNATWNNATTPIGSQSLFAAPAQANVPLPSTLLLVGFMAIGLIARKPRF
jgi:hypothetical protein